MQPSCGHLEEPDTIQTKGGGERHGNNRPIRDGKELCRLLPTVPDVGNQLLMLLIGQNVREDGGKPIHFPLSSILLQNSKQLLFHLGLITKHLVNLKEKHISLHKCAYLERCIAETQGFSSFQHA